jgi:predicted phosphate transport protein (TIGR00153 family)
MLGWFHALMPREERFFDLFADHSRVLIAGAEALQSLLTADGAAIPRHCQTIMDREHDADAITREVLIAIRRTFITPFDRGDIRTLIQAMDNAIDQMQQTAKAVTLFEVTSFEPAMVEMGQAAVECARLVGDAIPLLRKIDREAARIGAIAEQISAIEGRADELHDTGLKSLYQRHTAPNEMAFIIGSTIYDNLEAVVDRFDDIGNEINSVVIEHV